MDTEKRTEVYATRLTEKEAQILKERAKKQEISVSDFIRSRLFPCESKRLQVASESGIQVK